MFTHIKMNQILNGNGIHSVYAAIKNASVAMQKTSAEKPEGSGSIIATASSKNYAEIWTFT
jgi:glucokinase